MESYFIRLTRNLNEMAKLRQDEERKNREGIKTEEYFCAGKFLSSSVL
jgi:hypothetical protein